MADNTTLQSATPATPPAGLVVATDQIGGVDYQRVKATWGADGTATDVSAANPMPVVQTGTPTLPTGAAADASITTTNTEIGGLTEGAPASDTASSGLNGRLQRIAQRLTSIIALLPSALGAGGGLKVDGSGTALPVSGTVAATQSGTWNVTNLSGTVSLPTGAATAAKQPALGTAGTASADVQTVQGIAGMLPLTTGTKQVNLTQTPTCSTSPAYVAADAVGGLLTFTGAARVSGGSGLIQGVTVMCKTPALLPALELVLFNQTFTAATDNAAFNPSDGDMANCIGVIPINSWSDFNLNSIATRFGLAFPFLCSGSANLFGQLVTRSGFTLVSTTDLVIGVEIIQD